MPQQTNKSHLLRFIFVISIFLWSYINNLVKLTDLHKELSTTIIQRDEAIHRADTVLSDFSTAIKDPEIQQIYIKPICKRMKL